MFNSFSEVLEAVRGQVRKTIAVVMAQEAEVLKAANTAWELGLARFMLVGDKKIIESMIKEQGLNRDGFEIIDESDSNQLSPKAIALIREGKADVLMKGLISTEKLLKAVLDKEKGLRTSKALSHVAIFEPPGYKRLFLLTDAAMNIAPDLERKIDLIHNAATIAKALGIAKPRVAPVCAVETVNPEMPATLDAAILSKMAERGQLGGVEVDGPLALDNAVSLAAAARKGIGGAVAGRADILLMPDIEAGNVFYKALAYFSPDTKIAGLIAGARAPIVLTSRADSQQTKLLSIAVSLLTSGKMWN